MNNDDANIYINFVLYAVLGKLGEADGLMIRHGEAVHRVAEYLAARKPIPSIALYRGMLIEPDTDVRAEPQYTFVSWSEDRDVACWFAARTSYISAPLVEHYPRACGVMLHLPAERKRRVLFHHSWASGWAGFAALHPHMGVEGARQIEWSLRTQREVITAPLVESPTVVRIEEVAHPPVHELDRRLTPPWISSSRLASPDPQGCVSEGVS